MLSLDTTALHFAQLFEGRLALFESIFSGNFLYTFKSRAKQILLNFNIQGRNEKKTDHSS